MDKYKGRILCLTSTFPRWAGDSTAPFVLKQVEDLRELGWRVDVLAPHTLNAQKHEFFNSIEVHRFQYFWPATAQTVCYQGGALINLKKNPMNKLKLPFLVLAQLISLFSVLIRKKYDVIHAHWILPQGFNAVVAGKLLGLPVMVTIHGGDVFELDTGLMNFFKRKVLSTADVVTVNSEFTMKKTLSLSDKIRRLEKIPMGVDCHPLSGEDIKEVSRIREKFKKQNAPLLIFVGRLVESKGLRDLLDAVAIVKVKIPEIFLLIAGEGQDRASFEDHAAMLAIEDNVNFLGWLDAQDVRKYMAAADFFVGPSKKSENGWIEAQGLTFLEAMAAGTLVIATRSGGINETVIDGKTGFLVDESSPKQLAQLILKLVDSYEDIKEVRKQAYELVRLNYSREKSAQLFDSVLTDMIFRRRAS